MSAVITDNKPPEFSVRRNWRGQHVLIIRRFDDLPCTGKWQDVSEKDLPVFFQYVLNGRPTK